MSMQHGDMYILLES